VAGRAAHPHRHLPYPPLQSSHLQLCRVSGAAMTETRTIPLTQGQVALVDEADFEWLAQWKWYARWAENTQSFYAVRNERSVGSSSRQRAVFMHREILQLRPGDPRKGDHQNGDTLDNRRSNLRHATSSQNTINSRLRADNATGHHGGRALREQVAGFHPSERQAKTSGRLCHQRGRMRGSKDRRICPLRSIRKSGTRPDYR